MRTIRWLTMWMMLWSAPASVADAQNPPVVPPGAAPGRRGGGGRGGAPNMTLGTTAWPDGGMIPLRYTQAGPELSPAIQ